MWKVIQDKLENRLTCVMVNMYIFNTYLWRFLFFRISAAFSFILAISAESGFRLLTYREWLPIPKLRICLLILGLLVKTTKSFVVLSEGLIINFLSRNFKFFISDQGNEIVGFSLKIPWWINEIQFCLLTCLLLCKY